MIPVTKTYAPAIEKYTKYLEGIWERRWFTNHGPLVLEFEEGLRKMLGVKHLFFVTNGTIALQIAIKALNLKGNVITSPFSYVATTSSLVWEGCSPEFVDIDPKSFNLSPVLLEKKCKEQNISAIMAVHVYANPCDVKEIDRIAKFNNLKVIYDAAHAFNVKLEGQSILNFGDISTLSFHSTKVFHTIEGGAIITNDDSLAHKISFLRNFGHNGKEAFWGLGVNGKCSEFQAAMGLCMLDDYFQLETLRSKVHLRYEEAFSIAFESGELQRPVWHDNASRNYGYYPVVFQNEQMLLKIQKAMEINNIFPRRYFYPSLLTLPYITESERRVAECPIAAGLSPRILCLPVYPDLESSDQDRVIKIINENLY